MIKIIQRKKLLILGTLVIVFWLIISPSTYANAEDKPHKNIGLLHTRGSDILDKDDNVVRLRGLCMANGVYDETDINMMLGTQYEPTLADYKNIKALGGNTVRYYLQYHWLFNQDGSLSPAFFTYLDRQVRYAKSTGIYLILNLHYFGKGGSGGGFFPVNGTYTADDVVRFWTEISRRYAHEAAVAGYDLINEPQDSSSFNEANLYAIYSRVVKNLRSMNDDHLVFVADPVRKHDNIEVGYTADYMNADPFQLVSDPRCNIVYTYHWYKPVEFTLQSDPYSGYFQLGGVYPYLAYQQVRYVDRIYNRGVASTKGWVQIKRERWLDLSHWKGKRFSIALTADGALGKVWFDEVVLQRRHKRTGVIETLPVMNSKMGVPRSLYIVDKPANWYEDSTARNVEFVYDKYQSRYDDGTGALLIDNVENETGWKGAWKCGLPGGMHSTFYEISVDYDYNVSAWVKGVNNPKKVVDVALEIYEVPHVKTYDNQYSVERIRTYYVAWAKEKSVPLYCGEWGVADLRQILTDQNLSGSMPLGWVRNMERILNNVSGNMGMAQSFTYHDYKDYLKENRFYLGLGLFDPPARPDLRESVRKALQ